MAASAAGARLRCALVLVAALLAGMPAGTAAQDPALTFRTSLSLVTVDAIVRDGDGRMVTDLTIDDFEILEDGVRQQVVLFALHEARADVEPRMPAPASGAPAGAAPFDPADAAGRRLMVMLFDLSGMTPDDVTRAVAAGRRFVDAQMAPADVVAVATIGWRLQVLEDFTADPARLHDALARIAPSDSLATRPPAASTMATDEAEAGPLDPDDDADTPDPDGPALDELSELELFNNDLRLRAIRTLVDTLAPIEQRKGIVYFSGGLTRTGHDNQVELRAAINAAVRGNVAIYPVDARGLQAVVPGGDAARQSGRGPALFSGADVIGQYDRLARSQETLVTLAADTGGRAFLESNDLTEAFVRVQRDLAAYYLLGYTSTNSANDGRFRRIQVRVARPGLRVETRAGYYADRDFAYTSRADREAQLREQLDAAVSSTDLPLMLAASWFQLAGGEYEVPVSVVVPGVSLPLPSGGTRATLDLIGHVWDEQQRPIASLRQTVSVPVEPGTAGASHIQYQTSLRLPPGRFQMKVVARENAEGRIGSFERTLVIPELSGVPLKVSPVVVSTQAEPVRARTPGSPLVRDGARLLPNPTHIVGREQTLVFYFEVYEPALDADRRAQIRTSVAFYRGLEPVLETPLLGRTALDARGAVPVAIEVPASSLEPGLYTAQVTVIDALAREFLFPRLVLFVR